MRQVKTYSPVERWGFWLSHVEKRTAVKPCTQLQNERTLPGPVYAARAGSRAPARV